MPKHPVSSVLTTFWSPVILASMLSHTVEWLDIAAEDPKIRILFKEYELGSVQLSELAGIDPRVAAAYTLFQHLHKMKALDLDYVVAPEVLLTQRLNPLGQKPPFKFQYHTPFYKKTAMKRIVNVRAISAYTGDYGVVPIVEVQIA